MKTRLFAWVPIWRPWEYQLPKELFERAINDFCNQIPAALFYLDSAVTRAKVAYTKPSNEIALVMKSVNHPRYMFDWIRYLKIDFTLEHNRKDFVASNGEEITNDFIRSWAPAHGADVLEELFLLGQLAFPDHLSNMKGGIFSCGTFSGYDVSELPTHLPWLPHDERGDWPVAKFLSVLDVAQWVDAIGMNWQTNRMARNPIQRAFAAFTLCVGETSSIPNMTVFTAMQGLEAFYCNGRGDLRKQLSKKSRIFLGDWDDQKNIVGQLYDMRSRFVHGGFDLPCWKNDLDPDEEQITADRQLRETADFAQRLLTATLQKCIAEKIISVNWCYEMQCEYAEEA